MKLVILVSVLFGITTRVWGDPGDTLLIQGNNVNVRKGPTESDVVVAKLNEDHELIEIDRKDDWIEVGVAQYDGLTGWVHHSLVRPGSAQGATIAKANPRFDEFNRAFESLNNLIEDEHGMRLFTEAQDLGDGIVQVTATETWLSATKSEQQNNLQTIFDLWNEADGTDLPIAVYVVDQRGNKVTSMSR